MEQPLRYNDYSTYLKCIFPDFKVQKIALNAGFTCPNRDGTIGVGGCTYCNNQTFNPAYCQPSLSIAQQLVDGKAFFGRKYPHMKYLAYFQAYTNTYGELADLKQKYEEALAVDDIVGIVIGTRPDCMPDVLLDYITELTHKTFVLVEYGIESTNDDTLMRINRGHTFAISADAIRRTAARGVPVGAHVILGLPGENHEELMRQATLINDLPLTTLKIHQLQLIRGTRMAQEWQEDSQAFHLFTANEYIDWVIDYVEHLRPDLYLERFVSQAPRDLLIAPNWGLKPYEFTEMVNLRMVERGAFQGRLIR